MITAGQGNRVAVLVFFALILPLTALALEHKDPIKLRSKGDFCIECHRDVTPGIVAEWVDSLHAKTGVGCAECHESGKGEPGAFLHAERFYITTLVTTFTCDNCHEDQLRDFATSGHAKALETLRKMKEDDPRAPLITPHAENDFRACGACHGVEVKLDKDGRPNAATWPNSGAGRLNPDRGRGACTACHAGHRFSVAAARQPETCLRCHDGRDYPEGEIYRASRHGVLYQSQVDQDVLKRAGLYLDGAAMDSPTCAFCHFNGSGKGLLTRHNAAWRLPHDLTSPGAPTAPKNADNLRANMKSVCNQCHASSVIDRFFANADKLLADYQKNVMEPGLKRYQEKLAKVKDKDRQALLDDYSLFLAEGKRFRMNLYMGSHQRQMRTK